MNCPHCGAQSTYGLNYCKQCGNNLTPVSAPVEPRLNPAKLTGMFWAIAVLGLGGLGILFGCVVAMMALGAASQVVVSAIGLGASMIIGIASLLIWQLSRLITTFQRSQETPTFQRPPQRINAPVQPQIVAAPRPVSSVTEHTTRNFDPASYKET